MSKNFLLITAVSASVWTLPAFAQQQGYRMIRGQPQGVPSSYVSSDSISPGAQDLAAGRARLALPSTPLGANVRSAGDYLVRQPAQTQVKQGQGLAGLPDTKIGPAVGMPGDHVSAQRPMLGTPKRNGLGLEQARMGSTVGIAGDGMRSDLPNNGYKPFLRSAPVRQVVRTKPIMESEQNAATYGDYNDSGKRRF